MSFLPTTDLVLILLLYLRSLGWIASDYKNLESKIKQHLQRWFLSCPVTKLGIVCYVTQRGELKGHTKSSSWERAFRSPLPVLMPRTCETHSASEEKFGSLVLKSKQAVSSAVTLTQKPNKECLRVIFCCCPDRFLLCHLPFHVVLLQQAGSTGEKPFH